jgi:predicted PurR-regulated permease PerM
VKNQRFEQYLMIGLTAFAVIAASLLAAFTLFHFSTIRTALETLGKILRPFTIGCAIAYLLTPLYNLLLRNLSYYLGKTKLLAGEKARGVSTILAMLLSVVGSLALVGGLVALVIPGFVESLTTISNSMNLYTQRINQWVNSFFADSPETARTVETWLNASSDQLLNWVKETILPNLQGMSQGLGSGVSSVFSSMLSGMVVAFTVAKNVLVGFIVAAYLLVGKADMIAHAKRMVYGLFRLDTASNIVHQCRYIHQVFGGFLRGKLIDSLLIGMLCFIGTSLLQIPYAVLISVIIGVTNIIPFFGPFLGAVPCAVLVLLNSPIKCLTFVIFVFALQQFDGNILGPKILGDSTGLSSFWVLFAILLFGGLFGVVGMIIGVPVFAVLVSMLEGFLSRRLKRKELSQEEEDYLNLDVIRQGEDGGYVYPKMKDPTVRE